MTRLLFQYDDYDPTDIPADQAAPAPAEYLPAGRRGRNLRNRKEKMKMPGHLMMNTKRAKTGMNQRKPKAFRSSARRFSELIIDDGKLKTGNASQFFKRQGT